MFSATVLLITQFHLLTWLLLYGKSYCQFKKCYQSLSGALYMPERLL